MHASSSGERRRHRMLVAAIVVAAALGLTAVAASAAADLADAGGSDCASPSPTSSGPVASRTPTRTTGPVVDAAARAVAGELTSGPSADPSTTPTPLATAEPCPTDPPTDCPTASPTATSDHRRTAVNRLPTPPTPSEPSPSEPSPSEPSPSEPSPSEPVPSATPSAEPGPTELPPADPCDDDPVFGDDGTCLASVQNCDEYFNGEENDDPEKRNGEIPADKPVLVAIGDSITSGHHKERKKATECDDADYAYANGLFDKMNKEKPDTWADRDQYQNYAHSGFGTVEVLGGGANACGTKYEGDETPIKKAEKLLGDRARKGNFVVMSVGINDTNWVQLVSGIVKVTIVNKGLANAERCESLLLNGNAAFPQFDGFNFYDNGALPKPRSDAIAALRKKVSDNLTSIVKKLVAADPTVHIVLLNYYNASGSGFSPTPINEYDGPFLPEVCRDPVNKRLVSANGLLKSAARDAFANEADFTARVSVASVADLDDPKKGMLQALFADELGGKNPPPPGWPHPNEKGHAAIATGMFTIVKPKL